MQNGIIAKAGPAASPPHLHRLAVAEQCAYTKPEDWVLPVSSTEDGDPTGDTRSCAGIFVLLRSESDFRSDSGGAYSATILDSAAKCRDRNSR